MEPTMTKQFEPGDAAFTVEGQAVTFIAKVQDGFCVRPVYEDENGEPYEDGSPIIVGRIYAEPPVEQRNQQIADLDSKIKTKRDELAELQTAVRVTEGEMRSRMALIKRHKSLERLEDFIEGRITHFVFYEYGAPKIMEFKEAIEAKDEDRYAKIPPLKLLTLFGKSNGELNWRMDSYSDGSGGSRYGVHPCCSIEEAHAKTKEVLESLFEDARKREWGISAYDECEKIAAVVGIEIPEDLRAIHIKRSLDSARTELAKHELETKKLQDRIAALEPMATA